MQEKADDGRWNANTRCGRNHPSPLFFAEFRAPWFFLHPSCFILHAFRHERPRENSRALVADRRGGGLPFWEINVRLAAALFGSAPLRRSRDFLLQLNDLGVRSVPLTVVVVALLGFTGVFLAQGTLRVPLPRAASDRRSAGFSWSRSPR